MSYYMRFITTDTTETTHVILEQGLKERDTQYSIAKSGELKHGEDVYGVVEVNRPGDGLFDEEIGELKEFVEDVRGKRKAHVLKILDTAKAIVAVQVLFGDRQPEATRQKLNPLWEWLIFNRKGLWQLDDQGYFDQTGRILKVK
jgi:hypothetical protein